MHVRLIDANTLGYAQYFIGRKQHPDDTSPRALRGFLEHIRGRLHFDRETLNVIIWDGLAQWRYDLLELYKSSRGKTPEQREARAAYEPQRPAIQEALRHLPVLQVTHHGAEADDVAFGLARRLAAQGHLVSLSTSDTDWLCILAARIQWVNARKLTHVIELDGFAAATGFTSPARYIEGKALAGDPTDDIPGVPGVALKRAAELMTRFGDLSSILAAAQDLMVFSQGPKYQHALTDPDVRAAVVRNLTLMDLSKGPALRGSDIELAVGDCDGLALADVFADNGMSDCFENWHFWQRAVDQELSKGTVQTIERAVAGIEQSWQPGAV